DRQEDLRRNRQDEEWNEVEQPAHHLFEDVHAEAGGDRQLLLRMMNAVEGPEKWDRVDGAMPQVIGQIGGGESANELQRRRNVCQRMRLEKRHPARQVRGQKTVDGQSDEERIRAAEI